MSRGLTTGMPKIDGNTRKNLLAGAGAGSIGVNKSLRGFSKSTMYETQPAFKIQTDKVIPRRGSNAPTTRQLNERLESLVALPKHRYGTTKFDGDPRKRTQSIVTGEDTNFQNMTYMATLRPDRSISNLGEKNKATTSQTGFNQNPPSFYEDDMKKWQQKFEKSVMNRTQHKRNFFAKEDRTIFATNTNFFGKDPDAKLNETTRYTGGSVQPKHSEFKRVTQRRKSRQSVYAPSNIDIDYVGNTSQFDHLIKDRKLSGGQLSFKLNLRCYKNTTPFRGQEPWQFPTTREFSPRNQFKQVKQILSDRHNDYKQGFKDKKTEKNMGNILHMHRKNDQYSSMAWMCGLRGDRDMHSKIVDKKITENIQNKMA